MTSLHHVGATVRVGAVDLKIINTEKPGDLPRLSLLDVGGTSLLAFSMGTSNPELFKEPDEPDEHAPLVQFFVVKGPSADLDVLVPVAMVVGGSDCGYDATVVGITNRLPRDWLSGHAFINSQGGYYVGDLERGRGYGLAAWNFLWDGGAHYGAHRYEVNLFRFLPHEGRAIRIAHLETKKEYSSDQEALKELGLHYNNLLRLDPSFGC
jgi:hypothetical protein